MKEDNPQIYEAGTIIRENSFSVDWLPFYHYDIHAKTLIQYPAPLTLNLQI